MGERYKRSIPPRKHAYGDYPSTLGLLSRAKPSEKLFVETLANFLREQVYSDKNISREHTAVRNAEKIYSKLVSGKDLSNEEKDAVRYVIEKGMLSEVILESAWHPHNFTSKRLATTYPFQHPTVVLYTGQNKRLFFSQEGKEDILEYKRDQFGYEENEEFRNPRSILNEGSISRSSESDSINSAVFLTFDYKHAADPRYGGSSLEGFYDASVVFEVEVPSKWLTITKNPSGSAERFRNLDELREEYESPHEFRERIIQGGEEKIQFEIEKTGLPVNFITGVWDVERTEEPVFFPLERYHRMIFHDFPFRVPWNTGNVDFAIDKQEALRIRKNQLKNYNFYKIIENSQKLFSLAEEVSKILNSFNQRISTSLKSSEFNKIVYKNEIIPLGCKICGTIFKGDYCPSCGNEVTQSEKNPFIPGRGMKKIRNEVLEFENIFKNPIEWESKVRAKWKKKGQKYNSKLFYIEKSSPNITKDLEMSVSRLGTYVNDYLKKILSSYDEKEFKNSLREIEKDLDKLMKVFDNLQADIPVHNRPS